MPAHVTVNREWSLAVILCASMALSLPQAPSARPSRSAFSFEPGSAPAGYTTIAPTTLYTTEAGFGFEPGPPSAFSVAVPEGTYKVTVTLGNPGQAGDTTVYAELRRLMLQSVTTAPGARVTRSFLVDVRRPDIPGGGAVTLKDREKDLESWAWDDRLTIEFAGPRPSVARLEVEPVTAPTLFLLGDSTMCDQPREPFNSWGQMLTRFLKPDVAVANHAESGESLAGALAARRVDKIWSAMKKGDYLFVQFGHNDMKSTKPDALETYTSDLTRVVDEARRRGGIPVLVTSVSRRTFDPAGRTIVDSFKGYTQAVREVATAKQVALIDLQASSAAYYEALGSEASHLAFATMAEGTHHSDYGSYQIAKCVLNGIRAAQLDLAQHIVDDFTGFDPARPDPIGEFRLSKSRLVTGNPAPDPARARQMAEGGNDATGFDMAPETRLEVVQAAVDAIPVKIPDGPFRPTWESLEHQYTVPDWFSDAKFGIFLHWGVYSVPAYHNEWYEQHMYNRFLSWHTRNFGPPDAFGYKDFIPLFTAAKWDPDAWATLFRKSGAKYVIPTAQHHDNFALWDSALTPWNARQMGPKRDLIGELSRAVRAQGLRFGVSNHGIENFQFIHPDASPESKALMANLAARQADVFDPRWAGFYNVADRSDEACKAFLVNWAMRNVELIDKYQVDMLWFDNGVDQRYLDPLKLWVAAYYYNRAAAWGKPVSISTKKAAYAPAGLNTHTIGSIIDFEKIGARSPAGIRPGAWQVDHPIGSTWGYTSDMTVSGPGAIIAALADTASKNGNFLLNVSPMADGTIPESQQRTLLAVGEWLGVNGEAIYGTHNWVTFGDPVPNIRYTVKADQLYAMVLGDSTGGQVSLPSLATGTGGPGTITGVTMLGHAGPLAFTRSATGLLVTLPPGGPSPPLAYVLKIDGLRMNPSTRTASGNPPGQEKELAREWIDPDSGHRVIRLSDEPGSQSLYFHQNGYTPDGRKLIITTPTGLATIDLKTRAIAKVVEGRVNLIMVGRKTGHAYYVKTGTVFSVDLDSRITTEIGKLPAGASIAAVNADETLLAGTITEGTLPDRPATGGRDNYPAKGDMMERRLAARLPMQLITMTVKGGEVRTIHRSTDWLNHLQFSPTDPRLLMFCHEGPWHKVDRTWIIRDDGGGLTQIHHRTMNMEIEGHEFFSGDGRTIWYDLQTPRSEVFWLAGYEIATGRRTWYHVKQNEWSVHFNQSPDGTRFAGDGGGPSSVAAPDNGQWIYLFRPELTPDRTDNAVVNSRELIQPGALRGEKLVNLSRHDYSLEPNVTFTPDMKWIVFRSNMLGPTHVFAVEVAKAR